jgi:hypothetical protein
MTTVRQRRDLNAGMVATVDAVQPRSHHDCRRGLAGAQRQCLFAGGRTDHPARECEGNRTADEFSRWPLSHWPDNRGGAAGYGRRSGQAAAAASR